MTATIIIITVICYFSVLFGISYLSGRNADNQGFFTGNRKSSWYVVAFAMIGAAISGVTFVSVPGMVADSSFSYLQMVLGFAVGQFIIAFVLIPLFYKKNLTSIYEYLSERFGMSSYKTGAWFFFISKMLGASVRLFVVCIVMQLLVFQPLGIPFIFNVAITVFLVWLYTFQGGVKTLIWTDSFKTFCLILSAGLCIYYISSNLGFSFSDMMNNIRESEMSKVFFFDDVKDGKFFWKQFLAGVFLVISTTGLDQDFMQKVLSCKSPRDSQKNMITSGILQIFVIALFLMLGVLLYIFAEQNNIQETKDKLFPAIAFHQDFPIIVGILFIVGLISAAYSAAGSALTALTTSFTVDILGKKKSDDKNLTHIRKKVHIGMAIIMGLVIIIINVLNNTSVINAVYILASYSYGPILGMFIFGIFTKKKVRDKFVPVIALLSPLLCLIIDLNSKEWFNGYEFSHDRLILNALLTFTGLYFLSITKKKENDIIS